MEKKNPVALVDVAEGYYTEQSIQIRTCLHWACKQNHTQVVIYLLASEADKEILTNEGDLAAYLTSEIRALSWIPWNISTCASESTTKSLQVEDDNHENDLNLPAFANYMTNLPCPGQERGKVSDISARQDTSTATSDLSEGDASFCLSAAQHDKDCKPSSLHNETQLPGQGHSEGECDFPTGMETSKSTKHSIHNCPAYASSVFCNRTLFTSAVSTHPIPQQAQSLLGTALPWQPLLLTGTFPSNMQELVLKVRVQNPKENDFIEIELNRQELTYPDLLRVSCCELGVNPEQVQKIRKLPNTLVRKDKDVARLQDFQELEFVLGENINPPFRSVAATLTERPCYSTEAANLTY